MSDSTELALRAALNVLRDSIETGRMPSGLTLAPEALAMHAAVIAEYEQLLASALRRAVRRQATHDAAGRQLLQRPSARPAHRALVALANDRSIRGR